jgi:hypothetical protein
VLPEIAEVRAVEEACGRTRDENLAAVASRADACGPVDVEPDVSLVGHERLAGVDAHSDPKRLAGEGSLSLLRGGQGAARPRERDEESVALRVDLDAAVVLERLAREAAVLGERLRVAVS